MKNFQRNDSPFQKILVIPDVHVEPDKDLSRLSLVSRLIVDRLPDMIIDLGDFVSFNSLSHWDFNKRLKMEGRRYQRDCEAGRRAYDLLFECLNDLQRRQRRNKSALYRPQKIKLIGNHEEWPTRYLETHPEMEGFINLNENLHLDYHFDVVVPYRETFVTNGVTFCHAPMAQNAQPMSGKYVTARAWERHLKGVVFGHTHRLQLFGDKRIDGEHTTLAMSCGCLLDPNNLPEYTKGSESGWWFGVVMLTLYGDGLFDAEPISLRRMELEYAG